MKVLNARGGGRAGTVFASLPFYLTWPCIDGLKAARDFEMHTTTVNGEPGVVFSSGRAVIHVVSLRIEDGVRAVYMTNNPDKLSRWWVAEVD